MGSELLPVYQFGHLAMHLVTKIGWNATCLTSIDTTHLKLPFTHLNYKVDQSQPQPKIFYNPGSFEGIMAHLLPVYLGMKSVPNVRPDLVVGHMSYGTMLYLRNLYDCPFVGYFELLPPPFWSPEMVLRREYPPPEGVRLFNANYHALTYLHMHMIDAGYTPTNYQLTTIPPEMRYKFRVIHDGIDTEFFKREPVNRPTTFEVTGSFSRPSGDPEKRRTSVTIGPETRVVTYVSRGLESIRGFDIFMKAAGRIAKERSDTIFLIAGDERSNYGHELHYLGGKTFKQHVLSQGDYDPNRFHFLGLIPTTDLIRLYHLSDLHIYLTVPFVLSWSMLQAMASECVIIASKTPPVEEAMNDDVTGLLVDFYDADSLAEKALKVLKDPTEYRRLGAGARAKVMERFALEPCLAQLVEYFQNVYAKAHGGAAPPPAAPAKPEPIALEKSVGAPYGEIRGPEAGSPIQQKNDPSEGDRRRP